MYYRKMAAANGSTNGDMDDEELPPELYAELGDLILDNPNPVGINFMQVFGGDEDFGFNPGDEEMMDLYDSDGDSYLDDGEVEEDPIFTSLGDSHVIRRLSYHKGAGTSYQLPRVIPGSSYCYEEVYRYRLLMMAIVRSEIIFICKGCWRSWSYSVRSGEGGWNTPLPPTLSPSVVAGSG